MKIVNPSATIIEKELAGLSVCQRIDKLAGVCYQRNPKPTEEEAEAFCRSLIERGHLPALEFATIHLSMPWDYAEELVACKYLRAEHNIDGDLIVSGSIRAFMEAGVEDALTEFLAHHFPVFFQSEDPEEFDGTDFVSDISFATDEIPWQHRHVAVRVICSRAMCYDDNTQVLTKEGWKPFPDVDMGDEFLTFNDDGNRYEKPTAVVNEPYVGEMIVGESTMVDFCVTPNHRMLWYHFDSRSPTWRINEAQDVEGRRVKFQRGLFHEWEGTSIVEEYPQQSSIEFARFLGIFITDGSINKRSGNGGKVVLSQTKEFGREYIKKTLDALGWKYQELKHGFELCNSKLHSFMEKLFPHGEERRKLTCRVPCWVKSARREYVEAFMEGVIVGDGNIWGESNHRVIYSCNEGLAGDYQECILKTGKCSTIREIDRRGSEHYINGIKATKKHKEYIVSITDRTNEHLFNKVHWGRAEYSGRIHCVSIPSGVLYVRRNGKAFWCGNSHQLVRHRPCSFLQESARFCKYDDGVTFILPEWVVPRKHEDWFSLQCSISESAYLSRRREGLSPQQARGALNHDTKTELIVYASLPEWKHIFAMRCAKAADPEMRRIMIPLREQFKAEYPEMWEGK